jgi:hypothetical protein
MLFKQASGTASGKLLDAPTVRAAAGADHVIDQQPRNAACLGSIRLAFPQAVTVHLRRDPMDGLMGALKVFFHGAYEWSCRLPDLAAHHRLHGRLMAH